VVRVGKVHGTNATVRGGHEEPAEVALGDSVPDVIGLRSVPRHRLLEWARTPFSERAAAGTRTPSS
jgi:hypothetical protein